MARPPRHDEAGAWHHLMNRGADRQDIVSDDDDRYMFEHHTGELVRRGLLEIHAYVLMDNHFHFLGRSPEGELSAAMHRLGCEYARWYNRRHRRDGPLFRNRFVSVLIDDDEQLLVASRYIHRNPLAIVPAPALGTYRWSSLGPYLGRRQSPDWLCRSVLDELIGDRRQHEEFVTQNQPSDVDHARWAPFRAALDAPDIERALTAVTGADPASRVRIGRRFADPFVMLIVLAVELRIETAEQLAERYGLPSPAAVRTLARRGRVRLADAAAFDRLRSRTLAMLEWPMAA
ncbi:MAG TPA: transposase [Ilumatobacteraceae bacterium]|nr:transposase [Ilumatobacteraceae bacterium]